LPNLNKKSAAITQCRVAIVREMKNCKEHAIIGIILVGHNIVICNVAPLK